jgi:lambda family phage portal protein
MKFQFKNAFKVLSGKPTESELSLTGKISEMESKFSLELSAVKKHAEDRERYFEGASTTRLTSDWGTTVTSADAELRNDLGAMRSRWRELERNNDYAARFLNLLDNNIIGSDGVGLHMHILDPNGELDTGACNLIEESWEKWGTKINCTISGMLSFDEVCRLALRSTARDGSVLCQKIVGAEAGNPFGFALKVMEGDHLDRFYSGYAPNGNEVRLGVEYDKDSVGQKRKPVAYWITPRHPGDFIGYSGNYTRRRVPADEIIHLFRPTRFEQSEGVPWGSSAMNGLNMLGAYQETALVAARAGACQEGYFLSAEGEEYKGDGLGVNGEQLNTMEPGVTKVLPKGMTFVPHDPKHPTTSYAEYVKAVLRGIASGIGISYNTLANDLENVNYSSIRAGLLDERDQYRTIQQWFIESFIQPIFDAWLPLAFLSKQIALPFAKLDKFNVPTWKARSWDWVDPMKDMEANILAVNNYMDSPQNIISRRGGQPEKILKENAEWQALIKANGLPPVVAQPPTTTIAETPPEDLKDPKAKPA